MVKKWIIVGLTLALSLFLLAGCGAGPAEEESAADNGAPAAQAEVVPAKNAEEAVIQAVLERAKQFGEGECSAEGHVILKETEENGQQVVYALCSTGNYGFVNGNLEEIAGSGAIPSKLTFTVDEDGVWNLEEYWEPEDGSGYTKSIEAAFPSELVSAALNANTAYRDLKIQKEAYAKGYLREIGREAEVGDYADFEHLLATDQGMSVEASNYLLGEAENYPYFIGTEERIEDGVRWVYETAWEQTEDCGIATYTKTNYETGEVAEKMIYRVEGDKVTKIEEEETLE